MHLGRFHATIYDLTQHFKTADLAKKLENCAASLEQYAQSRAAEHLNAFRASFDGVINSARITDPDLEQPYAQKIISELRLKDILEPEFSERLQAVVKEKSFDQAGIASDFRKIGKELTKKTSQIAAIDVAFSEFEVEFERVQEGEMELGVLLPREVVGESLAALTAEFGRLGKLFHAINELTDASAYEPKVRTISSSWWQIFVELDAAQILVWVLAIERIVALFKSNLEIKELQKRLSENEIPKEITDKIEKEIERRISGSLDSLASEIRKSHAKITDEGRLNEIETQLRQGLFHLAKRLNQGGQIEINISVPAEPAESQLEPDGEGQQDDAAIADQKAKIAQLVDLRSRGRSISTETLKLDGDPQLLLNVFDEKKTDID